MPQSQPAPSSAGNKTASGIPVDSAGGPTVDPTKNVLDLVSAAVERLNDLREADSRRIDEIRIMEARRLEDQMTLRAFYDEKLREAEAKRIDAIRAVDVNAVAVASERATQQASILANQVAASAETLRALVASSAAATATQLTQIITPITDRLSLVERAQYEGVGKSAIADPQLAALIVKMDSLITSRAIGEGASGAHTADTVRSQWSTGVIVAVVLGSLSAFIGIAGLVTTIILKLTGH